MINLVQRFVNCMNELDENLNKKKQTNKQQVNYEYMNLQEK